MPPSQVRYKTSDEVDFVIIGSGAAGGVLAKELATNGFRVVVLEQGPYLTEADFVHDEVKVFQENLLTNQPELQPNTFRKTVDEKAVVQRAVAYGRCVGGTSVHFTANYWRFHEIDFLERSKVGPIPGTGLADWPITYADLEPYYTKVEWAFGVSGHGGANSFESPRSRDYPCPPMPMTRYAKKFHEGCRELGYNSFPTPMAALSRPYNGRPATVLSAFAQQHGDPTGTRSSALSVWVPDALATGRYDLRPDCYVHEVTVDEQGRCKSAVYQDADGDFVEQEADIFILSCGAIESARLLLLSRSGRFPNGLANGSDLVGRNATFHEFSAALIWSTVGS